MIIAIGIHSWGKGKTTAAALKEMHRYCLTKNRKVYKLYEVQDQEAYVTPLGFIHSKDEPKEISKIDAQNA